MKLSIAVITWNRAQQLQEALESCLACELPTDTQFVIIDNASTDNTADVVHALSNKYTMFQWFYEKQTENKGGGIGRNIAFSKAEGDYVYFMDDDAYISNSFKNFFIDAINIFDSHPQIATLTTQIYDKMWRRNRVEKNGHLIDIGIYSIFMVCGGSHFLRNSFFKGKDPYFPNKYGYEELLPSLYAADAEYQNAFVPNLLVIHNPLVNKWDYKQQNNTDILVRAFVNQYVLKSALYPKCMHPICYIVYTLRKIKYLPFRLHSSCTSKKREMKTTYHFNYKRLHISTVWKMFRNFGISVF